MSQTPDVKEIDTDSSTVEQTQDVITTDTVSTNESEVVETSSAPQNLASQISSEEVDEKGVSYKNRYYEMKRKLEESVESIPNLIEKKLSEFNPNKQTQASQPQEYTVSQLEEFAKERPEYRAWVEEEKAKIVAKNAAKEVEKSFEAREKVRVEAEKRAKVYEKIQNDYPNLFVKDGSGRAIGWDNSNPVVRDIAILSQDPRLKDDPEGLIIATELAHYRQLKNSQAVQQKELKTVKAKAKELEKKTFVEGASGKPAQSVKDPVRSAIEQAKQTGNKRDVQNAIAAYFNRAHLGG